MAGSRCDRSGHRGRDRPVGVIFMIRDPSQFVKAVASAFVADMERSLTIQRAVAAGRLDGKALSNIVIRDLVRDARQEEGVELFPNLRAVLRTEINVEDARRRGGMGEWAEIATAVIGAAGSYVTAKTTIDAQKKLANLEVEKQQLLLRSAELEAARQRTALAVAEGIPGAAGGTFSLDSIPWWVLPTGLAAIGVAAVAAFAGARR